MHYCFVFVCQAGELEIKALFLAASLRRYLELEYELVAAVPQTSTTRDGIAETTNALLSSWGVRTVAIENPLSPSYPIGNKLACLAIPTTADKVVFLDSDILCLQPFRHSVRFEIPFNAKPADFATFAASGFDWHYAYQVAGVELPTQTTFSTVSHERMPPYFNAGVIAVNKGLGLAEEWIRIARLLDADPNVPNKRPWLDQLALPIAVQSRGVECDYLDERYNYPAHVKPIVAGVEPILCHYHTPDVLRRNSIANAQILDLIQASPPLHDIVSASEQWRTLLAPYKTSRAKKMASILGLQKSPLADDCRKAATGPELLITGVPRSGTSYLCSLINQLPDCAVINEPTEIFHSLASEKIPYGVARYHQQVRQKILDGIPVDNKIHEGKFIEDTANVDTLAPWLPSVSRPDFLVASKNTLAYLARIPQLRQAMPKAHIAACIRHPLDTIASWKRTFPHLTHADMASQAVGHEKDPGLTGVQQQRLANIAIEPNLAVRRALLWRHLAEIMLEYKSIITVVRYEDLVANPGDTIWNALQSALPVKKSEIRLCSKNKPTFKSSAIDDEDRKAVSALCADIAACYGYEIHC